MLKSLLLAGAVFASALAAQTITSGDIVGTVTDPSSGLLPSAAVTLKNEATGSVQKSLTNSQGLYRFSFLLPGDYTVTVEHPGFETTFVDYEGLRVLLPTSQLTRIPSPQS